MALLSSSAAGLSADSYLVGHERQKRRNQT
jgi:hypothetical protein